MIDFVKIEVPPEYGLALLKHSVLSFTQPVNVQTGEYELTDAREAEFRGMTFTIYPSGRITLGGSIHKFYHNGTNWQDFTRQQFTEAVHEFCTTFELDPARLKILQLEAGVNITPPHPIRKIFRAFICHRKGNAFSPMNSENGRSLGINVKPADSYKIKVYDKGRQYTLSDPILRYENKYLQWCRYIEKFNIKTVSHLLREDAWSVLAAHLLETFDELIIREPSVNYKRLPPVKGLFFANAGRAEFWQSEKRKARYKARERLQQIVQEYGTGDLHEDIRTLLNAKIQDLKTSFQDSKKGDVLHDIPETTDKEKRGRFTTSINDAERHSSEYSNEENNCAEIDQTNSVRRCRTCGRDISNQRSDSVFCSEKLYGRDAKKCRNIDSNPRNNDLRALQRITSAPMLFDHSPYLRSIRHYQALNTEET